jgi:hypothetical protein
MKKYHLIAPLLCVFFGLSCKKNHSSTNNTPNADVWLMQVTTYVPKKIFNDVFFAYDNAHRVYEFGQDKLDSSGSSPIQSSEIVIFSEPADVSAPPSAYTVGYDDTSSNYNGPTDSHELSYDSQGRISKDTSLSGSGYVAYFSYPNGNIATTVLFDGTPQNNQIDTLFMSDGNISAAHIYLPNDAGTADSLEAVVQYGYSALINPAYHPAISASIGPLLYILQLDGYGGPGDFISQKAFNSVSGVGDGLPGNTAITYSQRTDSRGRLYVMSASIGPPNNYISYSYD